MDSQNSRPCFVQGDIPGDWFLCVHRATNLMHGQFRMLSTSLCNKYAATGVYSHAACKGLYTLLVPHTNEIKLATYELWLHY